VVQKVLQRPWHGVEIRSGCQRSASVSEGARSDLEARKQLENLQTLPGAVVSSDGMTTSDELMAVSAAETSQSLPSNWFATRPR